MKASKFAAPVVKVTLKVLTPLFNETSLIAYSEKFGQPSLLRLKLPIAEPFNVIETVLLSLPELK